MKRPYRLLLLLLAILLGCTEEESGTPPPLSELYFPSGIALAESGGRELLFVASSNFDLRYRAGVLHVLDREAIDRAVDEGSEPGRPARVEDLGADGRLVAAVEIPSLTGEVGVGRLGDGLRAIVPSRTERSVVAVDYRDGELRCAQGGVDCRGAGVRFPREDPFVVAVHGNNVYVSHVGRNFDRNDRGLVAATFLDAPLWSTGEGSFERILLGDSAIGGLSVGACRDDDGTEVCTVHGTGRNLFEEINPVFLFDFREGELRSGPLFVRNVYSQQRGLDTRGLTISSDGNTVYIANRSPASVSSVDVRRTDRVASDACILVPGQDSCPEEPLPLLGSEEPRFVVGRISPLPAGTNAIVALPRPGTSDLLVLTSNRRLLLFDPRIDAVVGSLDVGSSPSSIAFREKDGGYRLYVPSFGRGNLAVVDVPRPLEPSSAFVVGFVGRQQPGGF